MYSGSCGIVLTKYVSVNNIFYLGALYNKTGDPPEKCYQSYFKEDRGNGRKAMVERCISPLCAL